MSAMAREFFGASPLLGLPILALLIFTITFAVLSLRALRLGRARATSLAELALDEAEEGRDE